MVVLWILGVVKGWHLQKLFVITCTRLSVATVRSNPAPLSVVTAQKLKKVAMNGRTVARPAGRSGL